jgi:phage recombination protein Bet
MPEEKPTNSLIAYAPSEIANKDEYVQMVTSQLIKGKTTGAPTKNELLYFLQVAQATGLNPLTKQIYAIFRKNKDVENMTIQTGIDGLRTIAERSGRYAGSDSGKFEYNDKNELIRATVTVKKVIDGLIIETTGSAAWNEYAVPSNPMWRKMPETMLEKCAEAKALRKAFPNIGQVYVEEEMHQADRVFFQPEDLQKIDTGEIEEQVKKLVDKALEDK